MAELMLEVVFICRTCQEDPHERAWHKFYSFSDAWKHMQERPDHQMDARGE